MHRTAASFVEIRVGTCLVSHPLYLALHQKFKINST